MHTYVITSMASGIPLPDLMQYDPRSFATVVDQLEERLAAIKRARR